MGSWAETDGITQLPINYGDKVRAFILVHYDRRDEHDMHGGGVCYSNEIWSPLGCVKGIYDDYGGVEDIVQDINAKLLLSNFRDKWSKDITLEEALHCIEREEDVNYKYIGKTTLGIMLVLEDVCQSMIGFNPIGVDYNFRNRRNYIYRPTKDITKDSIETWYKSVSEKFKKVTDPVSLCTWGLMSGDDPALFMDTRNRFTSIFKEFFLESIQAGKSFEDSEVKEAAEAFFEMISIDDFVQGSRKLWTPQSGKGSQSNELDIYKHLNNTVSNIIAAREKKNAEEGDEVADENGYMPYMIEHNKREQDAAKENK